VELKIESQIARFLGAVFLMASLAWLAQAAFEYAHPEHKVMIMNVAFAAPSAALGLSLFGRYKYVRRD